MVGNNWKPSQFHSLISFLNPYKCLHDYLFFNSFDSIFHTMIKSPKFQQILDKQGVKIREARAASFQPTLLHGLVAVDCEDS